MSDAPTSNGLRLGGWTVPGVNDTNRDWFTSGALTLQRCKACGAVQHPPEELCHACGGFDFDSRVVEPIGRVVSYTVVHHSVHPALDDAVPYTVVLVALDEVPEVRVVGNLLDGDAVIGMPVVATWEELAAEDGTVVRLPQWRRDVKGDGS
jgi:uncharacterized OB-fold protein